MGTTVSNSGNGQGLDNVELKEIKLPGIQKPAFETIFEIAEKLQKDINEAMNCNLSEMLSKRTGPVKFIPRETIR